MTSTASPFASYSVSTSRQLAPISFDVLSCTRLSRAPSPPRPTSSGDDASGVAEPMYSTSGKATTTNATTYPPMWRALRTILGRVCGATKSRADGAPSGLLSHRTSRLTWLLGQNNVSEVAYWIYLCHGSWIYQISNLPMKA